MRRGEKKPEATRESFGTLIDRVATAEETRGNVLTDGQCTCAYGEVPGALEHIGRYLGEQGVTREEPLAFACPNSVPSALTLLHLLHAGHSFLLLPPQVGPRGGRAEDPSIPPLCACRVEVGNNVVDGRPARCDRPETYLRVVRNEAFAARPKAADGAVPWLYMRTSGSLGTPKVAAHAHAKLAGNALNCVERLGLDPADRVTIPVPLFHMYGLGAAFLPGVAVGASIDLQERSNILRYLGRERLFDPTVAYLTPALCEMLLKTRRSSRRYRFAVTAGARIKEETLCRFESACGRLVSLYGSTEMGAIAASAPEDPLDVRATTVGRPLSGVQMQCKEAGSGTSSRQVGELYCAHPYGFAGYVDNGGAWVFRVEETPPAWFRTGDLGVVRPDGTIEVLGRCDHSVNRSGHLVLFADIESALEGIEGVAQAVVVANGESKWGRRIVACCVPEEGTSLSASQVRRTCAEIMPRYAIPDDVQVLPTLPTLPNGKVDRPALAHAVPPQAERNRQ